MVPLRPHRGFILYISLEEATAGSVQHQSNIVDVTIAMDQAASWSTSGYHVFLLMYRNGSVIVYLMP